MKLTHLLLTATLALAATACDKSGSKNISQDENGACSQRFIDDYNAIITAATARDVGGVLTACGNFTGVHRPEISCQATDLKTYQQTTVSSQEVHEKCRNIREQAGQAHYMISADTFLPNPGVE